MPSQLQREDHLAGATIAVVKDGKVIFCQRPMDFPSEKRTPVTADSTCSDGIHFQLFNMDLVSKWLNRESWIRQRCNDIWTSRFRQPTENHHAKKYMTHSAGLKNLAAISSSPTRSTCTARAILNSTFRTASFRRE